MSLPGELSPRALDGLCREFEGIFSPETVTRFVADSFGHLQGARVKTFIPLLTFRFARERLKALAQAEGEMVKDVPEILFVCVRNAGRSQMAAALLGRMAGDSVHVRSAGSAPADDVHDNVREAMAEIGLDLADAFPKPLTDEVVRAADVVITMGCGDACPIYPGKRYEDWQVEDPAGQQIERVREIRDHIEGRVAELVDSLTVSETRFRRDLRTSSRPGDTADISRRYR